MPVRKRTDPPCPLADTEPLTMRGDLALRMVAGIDRFLDRELAASVKRRARYWRRDASSPAKYERSVEKNRKRLRRIIGADDPRVPARLELIAPASAQGDDGEPGLVGRGSSYDMFAVRWDVLPNVQAEGLLLVPKGKPKADVVALPDCEQTPEMLVGLTRGMSAAGQFARRLAESGCRVLVPVLIDRDGRHTPPPQPRFGRPNVPHREFIYRAAFEMGRHLIGFEVQKVSAAVDWFTGGKARKDRPVAVAGYGEGGLVALYAAAVDTRIDAVAVSGYFQPREQLFEEPIDRNVFSLLHEFGDAEIASLVAPRGLVVETCRGPEREVPSYYPERDGRTPYKLATPAPEEVKAEFKRALDLTAGLRWSATPKLVAGGKHPGSDAMLKALMKAAGIRGRLKPAGPAPTRVGMKVDAADRMKRQFGQLLEHTQVLMRDGVHRREAFWGKADAKNVRTWVKSSERYRRYFYNEVIGRFSNKLLPANPRTRLVYDEPKYRGYEVVLDVFPDVYAYGILLVPKRIRPGQRRPVVVCQHGLEGRPQHVANPRGPMSAYRRFACRLAERGFVTYAPQNPYIGIDKFRVLQRKLNPLKKTLFSVITPQHQQTLDWLKTLPFVDGKRIGFYGLSYGGKTAMRVPALLEDYCLSICSGDFNEWIWKNADATARPSYMKHTEYEMFEFDLGNTFNYAEMSWLICPRPFMVERGHRDGVAPTEWVAYEYAKSGRHYDLLGIGDRCELEVSNDVHAIHGIGTFAFLHKHLNWPVRG